MLTDAELRDAAVAELKLTTAGWRKPNGASNYPSGTAPATSHWGKAMNLLEQIGQVPLPPPPPSGMAIPSNGVITQPGTYSDTGVDVPIILDTDQLVTLDGVEQTYLGDQTLIQSRRPMRLELRRSRFTGRATPAPRLIDVDRWTWFHMENVSIEKTSGLTFSFPLTIDGAGAEHFTVTKSKWHNNQKLVATVADMHGQALQVRLTKLPAGSEISWLEIINEPELSWQEDVFSFITVAGIKMHDVYVEHQSTPGGLISSQGAYTFEQGCSDGEIWNCQAVDVAAAYGIYQGVRMTVRDSRSVSDGFSADTGKRLVADASTPGSGSGGGCSITPNSVDCHMHNITSGFVNCRGQRFDFDPNFYAPEGRDAEIAKNILLPDPITRQTELAERTLWQQKISAAGVKIGA